MVEILRDIINYVNPVVAVLFIIYAIAIFSLYIILSAISASTLSQYLKKNRTIEYNKIIASPFAPAVSILAPAFNEGFTIVENIRSLLSVYYSNYDVIVINDGSKDDTLEKVILEYELEKVNFHVNYKIQCNEIRGVYKSKNKSFGKLTVIDKVNGGKADALNAGINVSPKAFFVAIDVDSIIEPDAIQKLAKPFLEEDKRQVIATGGVIRIANDCSIKNGQIEKIDLPKKFLPKVQVLEYTRAFLTGRMAWAKLDGLLLISGALGMFDKDIVIKAGGYAHTVGEDMELIVRMRRYMADRNLPYTVAYIPDPLCWTEAPDDYKILGRQRNRWTRGTIDTLRIHKKLFFNPRYGNMGLLGYPFWVFFEWLAPLVEMFGILYFLIMAFLGIVNWDFFFLMLGFVYTFAIAFSSWAILFEELTFHRYERKTHIAKLFLVALLEPIIFHPRTVIWAVKGNIDYMRGKQSWGTMVRKGFNKEGEAEKTKKEEKTKETS